jgi:hypothetical protein
MTKRGRIEVAATADMTPAEVRSTNRLTKALARDYHMCPRCAVNTAAEHVKSARPEYQPNDVTVEPRHARCARGLLKLWEEAEALKARIKPPSSSRRDH